MGGRRPIWHCTQGQQRGRGSAPAVTYTWHQDCFLMRAPKRRPGSTTRWGTWPGACCTRKCSFLPTSCKSVTLSSWLSSTSWCWLGQRCSWASEARLSLSISGRPPMTPPCPCMPATYARDSEIVCLDHQGVSKASWPHQKKRQRVCELKGYWYRSHVPEMLTLFWIAMSLTMRSDDLLCQSTFPFVKCQ